MKAGARALPWLVAIAWVATALAWTLSELSVGRVNDDSPTFLVSPRVALAGDSPYVRAHLHAAFEAWTGQVQAVFPYMYPPPFLLMTAWVLAVPDFGAARMAWFAVNVAVTVVLALRLARWARLPVPLVLVGVVSTTATLENWTMGNVNLAVALVLVEAGMRMSGGLLAVGVMAKIAPVVVLPSLLLRGRRGQLAVFVGVSAALAIGTLACFPPGLFSSFVHDALQPMLAGLYTSPMPRLADPDNSSLSHALSLLGPGATPQQLSRLGSRVHALAVLGMALALALSSRRESPRSPGMLRIAGGYGAVMILAAPVAWNTHLVFALPALAHAWRVLMPARDLRRAAAFALLYVPFLVPSPWIRAAFHLLPWVGATKMLVVLALLVLCLRVRHPESGGA